MASSYEDHLRSLVLLHDQIQQDQDIGEKGAEFFDVGSLRDKWTKRDP